MRRCAWSSILIQCLADFRCRTGSIAGSWLEIIHRFHCVRTAQSTGVRQENLKAVRNHSHTSRQGWQRSQLAGDIGAVEALGKWNENWTCVTDSCASNRDTHLAAVQSDTGGEKRRWRTDWTHDKYRRSQDDKSYDIAVETSQAGWTISGVYVIRQSEYRRLTSRVNLPCQVSHGRERRVFPAADQWHHPTHHRLTTPFTLD